MADRNRLPGVQNQKNRMFRAVKAAILNAMAQRATRGFSIISNASRKISVNLHRRSGWSQESSQREA